MAVGRFAPSPTGALHLGNLRTALLAWLAARSEQSPFLVRIEDLDPVASSRAHEAAQLNDLRAVGLDWDGEVVRQSERFALYRDAISTLDRDGLVYRCWCTRREIAEASQAPNRPDLPDGAYPGTCRDLNRGEVAAREATGRPAALRLRSGEVERSFNDEICGPVSARTDDVVLARNDGVPAYNLAVVVDDAAQGIEQVVRGDDLVLSTPRQILLAELLGLAPKRWAHVPLVVNSDGKRLAKRDGSVTLAEQAALHRGPAWVCGLLAQSLGLVDEVAPLHPDALVSTFALGRVSRSPWTPPPEVLIRSTPVG